MTIMPRSKDVVWMAIGAALLFALMLVVFLFHQEPDVAQQLAFKAQRLELVGRMRLGLAAASEAEKSAVLATTDQDSQAFADQARAATAAVEAARQALAELLRTRNAKRETDLLDQFSAAFTDFRRIDEDLLGLAVKNTNLKAYALAFGPAADALKDMDAAISRLVAASAGSPDAGRMTALALGADLAALRVQVLLPPHIAEESVEKMDKLEAAMADEESKVRENLASLAALQALKGNPDFESAASQWARFIELKTQILALSRENTNVRSLNISLNRKRTVMLMCQDALAALERAIQEEPIDVIDFDPPR